MNKIVSRIIQKQDLGLNKNIITKRAWIKIFILCGWCIGSAISYMIFVNLSSTGGYFLRMGNRDLSKIQFEQNVIENEATKYETELQNKLNTSFVNYNNPPKSISINVNLKND